jgi:hypothetical protein
VSDPTFPREGGCMCGRVRVRVTAAPILTLACHCTGCQKLSASAFSLTAMFPAAAFEVISGETQIGALHGQTPYHFCSHCLNWLFTAPAAPFVMARPAMFDAPDWSTPFVETYVSEKLSWASTPAQHSFAQFPTEDQYGPILAAYAACAGAREGQG